MTDTRNPQIQSFKAVNIGRRAYQLQQDGQNILHMEYGQPSARPPEAVLNAGRDTIDAGVPGYWENAALKEAIAADYADLYGASGSSSQIMLTCGASPALALGLMAMFKPGDGIAFARPGYVAYRNTIAGLHMMPVEIGCDEASRFQLTAAKIEALDPAPKGLIIASPGNPTGSIIPSDELRNIVKVCKTRGIQIISDEIYHRLSFEMETLSLAALDPEAFVINSFSKYFCLPGWRIGWAVVPNAFIETANAYLTNFYLTSPSISQNAALAAIKERDAYDDIAAAYTINRELMLAALPDLGLSRIAPPDGAFYIYADISRYTDDSLAFCMKLLEDTGVATAPGVDFDPVNGHKFMRFSFALQTPEIKDAIERLKAWFGAL